MLIHFNQSTAYQNTLTHITIVRNSFPHPGYAAEFQGHEEWK